MSASITDATSSDCGRRALVAIVLMFAALAASAPLLAQGICPAGNVRVAPDSRYLVFSGNLVLDLETRLIWKRCLHGMSGADCTVGSASALDWSAALVAADAEALAGLDWRLPDRNELRSLVERGCWSPAINTTLFPGSTNLDVVWTSTTRITDSTLAWAVGFGDGGVFFSPKSGTNNVRLVAGGDRFEEFDAGADFTPDAFSIPAQAPVPANTLVTSAGVIVAGIDTPVGVGVTGAASSEYRINGGAFTSLPGVVRIDQGLEVRHLSAAGPLVATTTTLRIGSVTADFTTTTAAGDLIFGNGFEPTTP